MESPFRWKNPSEQQRNIEYARAAVRDCLLRGESPIASHLLHTQKGILNDAIPEERKLGMNAGHAWIAKADAMVVYGDLGMSSGMVAAIHLAIHAGVQVVERTIKFAPDA